MTQINGHIAADLTPYAGTGKWTKYSESMIREAVDEYNRFGRERNARKQQNIGNWEAVQAINVERIDAFAHFREISASHGLTAMTEDVGGCSLRGNGGVISTLADKTEAKFVTPAANKKQTSFRAGMRNFESTGE